MNPVAYIAHKHSGPVRTVSAGVCTAAEGIGPLEHGARIIGVTKGQFSLLDILRHVLDCIGPAHVLFSTWRVSLSDAENVNLLFEDRRILSVRCMLDRSCGMKQAGFQARMLEMFGAGSITCTRTHAKWLLARNAEWNIAIRSSMNLNRNPRFEQFDIDDDAVVCDFLEAHLNELHALMPPGFEWTTHQIDAQFKASMGGGLSEKANVLRGFRQKPKSRGRRGQMKVALNLVDRLTGVR